METCTLRIELESNSRTTAALMAMEDHYCDEGGWAVYPLHGNRDVAMVSLQGLDFGRYDAEGDAYVIDLLNIVPADLIDCYLED